MRQLRRIRSMLHCWFCGGRVVALSGETRAGRGKAITAYRCEAEGVTWDMTENLVIYGPRELERRQDPKTGKYVSPGPS